MPFGASGGGVEPYVGLGAIGAVAGVLGVLARRFLSGVERQKDNLLTPCYDQLAAKTTELAAANRQIERLRILCRVNGVAIPDETWSD